MIYRAMAWQIAREIGAAAAALGVRPDAVILTGGLAWDERLVGWIRGQVEWIAPVRVYPGEGEMAALAAGAIRVISGEEEAREYQGAPE
jgi:butyrate kinase